MEKEITYLDLFSGAGGFALGLQKAGFTFKNHYYSEIDKHAIACYKHKFKNAKHVGSVTDVRGGELRPDIITFGSPCQDFSIAGKGDGLEGKKSSLIMEAIRIIAEAKPSVFIWENVKGTFSSNNGADFWAIIRAFTDIGDYRLEWQLLNTLWLLPQNRERIYLVGHLDGKSRPKVFPVSQSSIRVIKGVSKATATKTITAGGNSGGHHSGMTLIREINPPHAYAVTASNGKAKGPGGGGKETLIHQANPNTESGGKQPYQHNRVYLDNGVIPALGTDERVNVKPISTPDRKTKDQNGRRIKDHNDPMFTLSTSDIHGVQVGDTIRRLTPVEFERLQGFPDDWTRTGIYNGEEKEISDTQRYKLMGNAVTTDIVELVSSKL